MPAAVPHCTLLDSVFGTFVQVALALIGVCALVVKRNYESPRRAWKIWALDVSKQAVSGVCAHLAGIINSLIVEKRTGAGDECSWYLIAFSLDTSFGVLLAYLAVKALAKHAPGWGMTSLKDTGNYGEPPDYGIWAKQLGAWCIITVAARACILVLMLILQAPLSWLSNGIAQPLACCPEVFLVLVMVAAPVGMNLVQLWIQDNFLKNQSEKVMAYDTMPMDQQPMTFTDKASNLEQEDSGGQEGDDTHGDTSSML